MDITERAFKRLVVALMLQGIEDYLQGPGERIKKRVRARGRVKKGRRKSKLRLVPIDPDRYKNFHSAKEFIFANKGQLSFEDLCIYMKINTEKAREALKKQYRQRLKEGKK